MAHNYQQGKVYIDTSGQTPVGIEVGEVKTVIGARAGEELYYHNNVSPWPRKKPVPWSTAQSIVIEPRVNHPNDWFLGKDGNFGLESTSQLGYSSIVAQIDGNMNGWAYQRDSRIARLLDFDGYYHYAKSPFAGLEIIFDNSAPSGGAATIYMYHRYRGAYDANDEIRMDEVVVNTSHGRAAITGLYLGLLVWKKNGNSWTYDGFVLSTNTIASLFSDPAMHTLLYSAGIGIYRLLPVISETNINPSELITIPGQNFTELTISQAQAASMRVDAYVISNNGNYGNTIYYRCVFMAGAGSTQFRDVSVKFNSNITQSTLATISNVQSGGVPGQSLLVNAGAMVYVPSNGYSQFTWPSQSVSLTDYVNLHGAGMLMSGSGADDYTGRIDVPAQPRA